MLWDHFNGCSLTCLSDGQKEGDGSEGEDVAAEDQPKRGDRQQEDARHGHVTSAKCVGQEARAQSSHLEG